jgi:predicted methyltransferase
LGEDGSADMVLTFRNIHGSTDADELEAMFMAAHRVLKPGGVFGVEQHRADEGVNAFESARLGYIPESFVIARAEAAGFELAGRSDVNAKPADTKDHASGVWSLPPPLRGNLDQREAKLAVCESDRMTLRLVKPTG